MNVISAIEIIKNKFSQTGSPTKIPLLKGEVFLATLKDDGILVDNLGSQPLLPWVVFQEAICVLIRNGGSALRGDAMQSKLGEAELPLDSIEGHIAHVVYGKKGGDTVFRRITPISCILIWAGVCVSRPRKLILADSVRGKNWLSEEIGKIVQFLERSLVSITSIKSFSDMPGIYGIGFFGHRFPLASIREYILQRPILYIGKTEYSQLKRTKKTHFTSGKTGSSAVRRSFGAILREELSLAPIPRSTKEKSDNKYRNYRFKEKSEERLTTWMLQNLSLSFWEYSINDESLSDIETQLIDKYVPVLNLKHNPKNPYRAEICTLRKICRDLAREAERGFRE